MEEEIQELMQEIAEQDRIINECHAEISRLRQVVQELEGERERNMNRQFAHVETMKLNTLLTTENCEIKKENAELKKEIENLKETNKKLRAHVRGKDER